MQSQLQYHIFSLPEELLASLTPRNLVTKPPSRPASQPVTQQSATGPRACNVCLGVNFSDVNEQRAHFRSDWHRYNVKIRLRGGQPVPESQFAQLVEGLEDSLSGSASSTSEEDESETDAVSTLLQKSKKLHLRSRSPSPSSALRIPQSALIWFHSPPQTQIGIYRTIFPSGTTQDRYLDALKDMQQKTERTWAMFMVAGGHFAGALVRVSQGIDEDEEDGGKKKKQHRLKQKVETEVLKHKTFHRYTTRRKQGGSQSVNDNAKGPAKSAGAQLRRYGEQALREDIRGLLEEWAEDIDDCELVWIRASTSNRRIFLDYDEAPIKKGDERLRTFPFPTRRPTQSELTRCLAELVRPKVSHFTEEELKEQDEAFLASLPKPKPVPVATPAPAAPAPKVPKLTKEEEIAKDKWLRALDMTSRGRIDALKAFLAKEGESLGGIDGRVPEFVGGDARGRTLLMIAASQGQEDLVKWLLEDARADPTVLVLPKDGDESDEEKEKEKEGDTEPAPLPKSGKRTAYDLAKDKATRDVFRRCAYAHPEWHDWLGAACVPSVLSPEMEEQQEEKKKVRRKGLKDRVKEREAKEREKEKERVKTPEPEPVRPARKEERPEGPRKLGGAPAAAEGLAGLTPEMRMKVERERRARAAEARFKTLGGSGGGGSR